MNWRKTLRRINVFNRWKGVKSSNNQVDAIVIRRFLIYWYYFWGCVVSEPMLLFDWGYLYKYYNKWMTKSVDYDTEEILWKSPKRCIQRNKNNKWKEK